MKYLIAILKMSKTRKPLYESVIDVRFQSERDRLATKEDLANAKSEILKWMIILFAPFYVA